MTRHRSFKHLVRTRMAKTGESYTAARAVLLAGEPATVVPDPADGTRTVVDAAVLATSDATIRQRTGRGWEEWFDLLDDAGMGERPHREVARWVADLLGVVPLAWPAQAVTGSYERARGRAVGEHADGFAITVTRTVPVPVERLFDAFVDVSAWAGDADLRQRTATRPKSARFDRAEDGTRVNVTFVAKDPGRSTLALEHRRLADAEAAATMRRWWTDRLAALRTRLDDGATDA